MENIIKMRTEEEKQRQIEGLKRERETLPEISFFGDNNWEPIDAMVSMLMGLTSYQDYEDVSNVESEAYRCQSWLDGNTDEDLFSE